MDKIDKELKKLSSKERKKIKSALLKLYKNETKALNIKKLKSRGDIFRLRIGGMRVIYRSSNNKIFILAISRRNEKTYK